MKTDIENVGAVRITSYYRDFHGTLAKWEEGLYMLWRYQMTWEYAYQISVDERRETGVLVDMVIRPAFKDQVVGLMEELGYRETRCEEIQIGIISAYDLDDTEEVYLEW